MSQSYPEYIRRALDIFKRGFTPFVEHQMVKRYGSWQSIKPDTQALLRTILNNWDSVFSKILGEARRRVVDRVRRARNMLAHENTFRLTNIHSLLDDIQELLTCISAHQEVQEIKQLRQEIEREHPKRELQKRAEKATRQRGQSSLHITMPPREAAMQRLVPDTQGQESGICPYCLDQLRINAKFCNTCGKPIKSGQAI